MEDSTLSNDVVSEFGMLLILANGASKLPEARSVGTIFRRGRPANVAELVVRLVPVEMTNLILVWFRLPNPCQENSTMDLELIWELCGA